MTRHIWLNWLLLLAALAIAIAGPTLWPLGRDYTLAYLVPVLWYVLLCGLRADSLIARGGRA